jgi:putative membrane protein
MKQSILALAALPPLALLAACGGTTTTNTSDTLVVDNGVVTESEITTNQTDGMLPLPTAMTGQQFADTAAASDAYEIEAGKLARTKATGQALKDFGAMMVKAHTDSTAKLKDAASKATPAITPNAQLTAEQQANLDTLRSATGADFDTAYKSQQVTAHTKALQAMQGYAATGDVTELKAFAGTTATVVQEHLDKISGL